MTSTEASPQASFNPLSSPQWHRVATVRPKLSEHVRITRQWVRGQRWHVLLDTRSGQSCRLNAAAYDIAARLDGRFSLQALWALLDGRQAHVAEGTEPPSQDEVLAVVRQLHEHSLLHFDEAPDFGALATPVTGHQGPAEANASASPGGQTASGGKPPNNLMSWRLPLLNPDAWLQGHASWAMRVFSFSGMTLWCLSVLALLTGMLLHGPALAAHARDWMHTPRYLLIAALTYPVMKALHELAHALAVQRWGGRVQEAGITLMMLMPVPYVDASAAHGFSHAWQRAMVSAAGIMTELTLAAIGLWCWQLSEPGLPRDIGFVLWFVGGISTLLFNANPLQRLDGYHLLTDALHLPNLAQRSKQWWQRAVSAWLHGRAPEAMVTQAPPSPGERPWLLAYAPMSWLFQCGLMAGLTWWLGGIASGLGWMLGAVALWMCVLSPGLRWTRIFWQALLWSGPHQTGVRLRAMCLLTLPLLLALPWPDRTVVQGVVWAPEEALVRPQTEGVVQTVHARDGQAVHAGDLLVTLHNPKLAAQRERIAAQIAQAEQGAYAHLGNDAGGSLSKAGQAGDALQRWQAELRHVEAQIEALNVRAKGAGTLVLPLAADLPGRYLKRGELLGHVLSQAPTRVRLAMPDDMARGERWQRAAVSVALRTPSVETWPATLLRDSVGATRELPSAALSQDMGGDNATEPHDERHLRTLRPVVMMDVEVRGKQADAAAHDQARLGERVWVRFDQGLAPLPWQAWRWIQRRAAADFNPRQ